MDNIRKLLITLCAIGAAMLLGGTPVIAGPPAPTTPIDDASGDPSAPGVNVIRRVESAGTVVVRLNREDANGGRLAHFNIIVRGIDIVDVTNDFPSAHGVDGNPEDGIWGLCANDELLTDFGNANLIKAKFTTCGFDDSVRIHLGDDRSGNGSVPAIKIVFTEGALENTHGVFVGDDPEDVGNGWIPLFD